MTKEQERQIRILIQKLASESYSSSFMAGVGAGLKEVESILDRINPAPEWILCAKDMPAEGRMVFVSDGRDVGLGVRLGGGWKQFCGPILHPLCWQSIVYPKVVVIELPYGEASDAEKS